MNNLQDATERICDLKGSLVAIDALVTALLLVLPESTRTALAPAFERHAEMARNALLHASISEYALVAFERDVQRTQALIGAAG